MSKILLATEAVTESSPVRRLALVADALRRRGHDTIVAAGDLLAATALAEGNSLIALPVLAPARRPSVAAAGYSGLLIDSGFLDAPALHTLANGCDTLLAQIAPDAIVLDRAPVLSLASWGKPRLLIGEGAHLPPPGYDRLRSLGGDAAQSRAASMQELVMGAILRVQNRRFRPAPDCPADVFSASERLICTLAEFDPFVAERTDRNIGPLQAAPQPSDPWAARPEAPRIIAVVDGDYPHLTPLLAALAQRGLKGELYVAELPGPLKMMAEQAGVLVRFAAWPADDALQAAQIVVHHGEQMAVEHLLALGRPQLLLPRAAEQIVRGQILASRGIGALVTEAEHLRALDKIVARLAADRGVHERAYAWARTVQEEFNKQGAELAADAAERLALAG